MVDSVGRRSPSTSQSGSADAIARRQAEEAARRRAEEARRAAEAARKAAEDAARKAQEAQRAAQAARRFGPEDARPVQDAARKAKADSDAAAARAQQLQGVADQATREANTTARANGKPAPFPEPAVNTVAPNSPVPFADNSYGPGGPPPVTGAPTGAAPDQVQQQLDANQQYARLAADPRVGRAMAFAGIRDGATLQQFATRVATEGTAGGAARPGDISLADIRRNTDPATLSKLIQGAATTVPGPGGALLADPKFADAVGRGQSPRDAANAVRFSDPAEQGLHGMGVDTTALASLPPAQQQRLRDAGTAFAAGHPDEALRTLAAGARDFASSPQFRDLAASAVTNAAARLPDGAAKTLLSNPDTARALLDPSTASALGQLVDGNPQGVRALLGNDALRNSVLDAAAADPRINDALTRMGLSTQDLKDAGAAAPHLFDALSALQSGNVTEAAAAFGRAVQAAPQLAQRIGDAFVGHLPDSVKQQLSSLGVSPDALRGSAAALPDLVAAADSLAHGQVDQAFRSLQLAAQHGLPLGDAMLSKLADAAPPGSLAHDVLGNAQVRAQLLTNTAAQDSLVKILQGGDGAMTGVRELLGNDALRGPLLDAVGNNDTVKQALSRLNLTPQDLKDAGAAAPHVLDALDAATHGDLTAMASSLQAAYQAAPDLAERLGQTIVDKLPQPIKDQFNSVASGLGISVDDLRASARALPDLVSALDKAAHHDFQGALGSLRDAAAHGSPVVETLVANLAGRLPEGMARTVLANPQVIHEFVTNTAAQDSVLKLLSGDPQQSMAAVGELLHNDTVRDAVLGAVANDPGVTQKLQALGLTPRDLQEAGAAAPHLWDAVGMMADGHFAEAFNELKAAMTAAPGVTDRLIDQALDHLPQGATDLFGQLGITVADLKASKAAIAPLFDAVQKFASGDVQGAFNALADATQAGQRTVRADGQTQTFGDPTTVGSPLFQKLLAGAAARLPPGIAQDILKDPRTADAFFQNPETLRDLGKLFNDGERMDGIRGLLGNDDLRGAVVGAVANDPQVQAALARVGLTGADLTQAADAAPQIFDVMDALGKQPPDVTGALEGLSAAGRVAPDLLAKVGGALFDKLPPNVTSALADFGVTRDTIGQLADAVPHLVAAAQDVAAGHFTDALAELGKAAEGAPSVVEAGIARLAEHVPPGIVHDLMSDPTLVKTLVEDHQLHGAIGDLLSTDPESVARGVRELAGDPAALQAVGTSMLANPRISEALAKVGITSPQDFVDAGRAIGDVVSLITDIQAGKVGDSLQDFVQLAGDLPEGLRRKISDTLTRTLGLPPEVGNFIMGAANALSDPALRAKLGAAVDAFKAGDPLGFVSNIADLGKALADNPATQDVAIGFLDSLKYLPGSVGQFFGDHDLNAAIVHSGAMSNVCDAVKSMVGGDVLGGLQHLLGALGDLASEGDHFRIEVPFPPHQPSVTLPFGAEGIENIGRLVTQFAKALPEPMATDIGERITQQITESTLDDIPGAGIVSAIGDGKGLIDALSADHIDGVEVAIKLGEVGLDVASIVGIPTGPLRAIVGTVDVLKGVNDMVNTVQNFGDAFAFGAPPPPPPSASTGGGGGGGGVHAS